MANNKGIKYDHELMTDIRIAGFLTEEEDVALTKAIGKWDEKYPQKLFDKYHDEYIATLKKDDIEEVEEEEPVKDEDPNFKKATLAYKKVSRMLKFDMLKAEVLLQEDYTCICCEQKFPTKNEFKEDKPEDVYPLFVRCNFPIVKYIQKKRQFDPKVLAKDTKIFNKDFYSVICTECKPLSFLKRKKK